ncbi:glycoside hydrolase family 16 protein [Collybia nuda]|uniref:Glycoside hydrolase family 16 protein n=1 Tax=Collybia nuda TaxID=64659 RepID=A0A9P5Y3P3_9AGAR|nr:glycoside hydrolase family 16 protein [Collybia nuda]
MYHCVLHRNTWSTSDFYIKIDVTQFSLSPDPAAWGSNLSPSHRESDDELHNPDPRRDRNSDFGGSVFTIRGLANVGCIAILCVGLLALFAGYPLVSHFTSTPLSTLGGFNIGGINATGQVPDMTGNWGLIDRDTPQNVYTKVSYHDPKDELQLVFSDEFNIDGRTFYPGDDPYWEATDLHYWATNNMEWYDPAAITTKEGALEITLSQKETHDLHYQGGMMSTWNKFCFTGGLIETAVTLPGINNIAGLWPAIWTMGNLGRAGYGASLEGMWPYTYDACDVGTAPNQTINGQPEAATINGDTNAGGALSFLPGQRLSRCTCPGEPHPGPAHANGEYVGRAAPEIDIFEAQITGTPLTGQVSQSAQWAPFNDRYLWFNTTENMIIVDADITISNPYLGGAFQQATSGVTETNQGCYELTSGCFSVYGFEYKPGFDNAYISWVSEGKLVWTLNQAGMAADPVVNISARPIPQEPMYIIANLGMSTNFGDVDIEHLTFPTKMRVDWIRVYQPKDAINVGCDPKDFPTQAYINQYIEAYTNPNLTTWRDDFKQPFPKNRLIDKC